MGASTDHYVRGAQEELSQMAQGCPSAYHWGDSSAELLRGSPIQPRSGPLTARREAELPTVSPVGLRPELLIEPDPGLRRLFTDLLMEEGYELVMATSLEESVRLVEEQTFALVLADGWVGRASLDLLQVHTLRARVYPVPVAVLTRLPLPPSAKAAEFAFVLPLPFNIDACLSLIATTLNAPLSEAQHAQVQVVHRLIAAIEAGDWEAVVALHTDDVICVPPDHSRGTSARWIQGQAAFRAWAERLFESYQQLRVSTTLLAATPRGLAVRYTMRWQEPTGPMQRAGTLFLRFQGERICQVGIRITLPPLAGAPASPPLLV